MLDSEPTRMVCSWGTCIRMPKYRVMPNHVEDNFFCCQQHLGSLVNFFTEMQPYLSVNVRLQ